MLAYCVNNKISKAPLSQIRLNGYAGRLMDLFFEERIFSDYARDVILRECEDGFVNRIDDHIVEGIGFWQGEFWGKWIISACRAVQYSGNEKIRTLIHESARKLIALQDEDGYLGTYKNSANFMAPSAETAKAAGFPQWNWNIWCRKYTLWGMLEAYELIGDEALLTASVRIADNLLAQLKAAGRHIGETGTFVGMPSCSIMKPMLILYRITGNKTYLDFCLSIADRWEDASVSPGLIVNALSGKPISEWYPNSDKWAKAYEMMSCYDGLIELYRVTGTKRYLDAAECFVEIILKFEQNSLFSVGFNDMFMDAARDTSCITEPCDIIHLMRLCYELFTLTGKASYMDAIEAVFCNAFLAGAYKDGKWGARGVRSAGRHLSALVQAEFTKNHCCVNNMPRGFLNAAESCVMLESDAVIVNLYTESEVLLSTDGHTVSVSVTGDYLADSAARVHVNFGTSPLRNVRLRIPAWTSFAKVRANGTEYTPDAGYFTVSADDNQIDIEVEFDNSVRVCMLCTDPFQEQAPVKKRRFLNQGGGTWSVGEDAYTTDPRTVLRKGVVTLCRSKLIGNTEAEMFHPSVLLSENAVCTLKRLPGNETVHLIYDMYVEDGDKNYTVRVCDFASGTNLLTDDTHLFNMLF